MNKYVFPVVIMSIFAVNSSTHAMESQPQTTKGWLGSFLLGNAGVKFVGKVGGFQYWEDNKEADLYIKELEHFAAGLKAIADEKKINSPRKKLALFIIMTDIFKQLFFVSRPDFVCDGGYIAGKDLGYELYDKNSKCLDHKKMIKLSFDDRSSLFEFFRNLSCIGTNLAKVNNLKDDHVELKTNELFNFVRTTVFQETFTALTAMEKKQLDDKEVYECIRRTAQDAALKCVLTRPSFFIEKRYEAVLAALPEELPNNPFASDETLKKFKDENFFTGDKNGMMFLSPWFAVLGMENI